MFLWFRSANIKSNVVSLHSHELPYERKRGQLLLSKADIQQSRVSLQNPGKSCPEYNRLKNRKNMQIMRTSDQCIFPFKDQIVHDNYGVPS